MLLTVRNLVENANEWLQKNPSLQVKTCETITWMSHDLQSLTSPQMTSDQMMTSRKITADSTTHYVRGLRSDILVIGSGRKHLSRHFTLLSLLPLCDDRRRPVSSSVTHLRQLFISRTVCAGITKFYLLIGNHRPNKNVRHGLTSCFRSAVKCN